MSPDHKYYFFSRLASSWDIYWVDARALDLYPILAVSLNDTHLTLSWSTNFPDCALESVPQLGGTWTPVAGITGYSITLPVTADRQFFRLRQ